MSKKEANIGGNTISKEKLYQYSVANENHWHKSFAIQAAFLKDILSGKVEVTPEFVPNNNPFLHKLIKSLEDMS